MVFVGETRTRAILLSCRHPGSEMSLQASLPLQQAARKIGNDPEQTECRKLVLFLFPLNCRVMMCELPGVKSIDATRLINYARFHQSFKPLADIFIKGRRRLSQQLERS